MYFLSVGAPLLKNHASPSPPQREGGGGGGEDETFFRLSVFLPNVDGSARGESILAFFIHLDVLLRYVS